MPGGLELSGWKRKGVTAASDQFKWELIGNCSSSIGGRGIVSIIDFCYFFDRFGLFDIISEMSLVKIRSYYADMFCAYCILFVWLQCLSISPFVSEWPDQPLYMSQLRRSVCAVFVLFG